MRNERENSSNSEMAAIEALENGPALITCLQEKFLTAYATYNKSAEKNKKLQTEKLTYLLRSLLEKILTLSEKILNPPRFDENIMHDRFINNSATLCYETLQVVLADVCEKIPPILVTREISALHSACEEKLDAADTFIQKELALIRTYVPAEVEARAGKNFTDYEPQQVKMLSNSLPQTFFGKVKAFFKNETTPSVSKK